jgi:peptidyl-prolyl cis-trans isomerase C
MRRLDMWMRASIAMALSICFATVAVAEGTPETKVLAVVGDQKITQQEVDQITQKIPEPFRKAFAGKALERLIDTKVFYDAAVKAGLERSPEFKAKMKEERERILADFFVEKEIMEKSTVTPQEVESYYNSHRQEFNPREMARTGRIAVKTEEEARKLEARLAQGEPFETLAREKSIDPSAKRGGEMGWQEVDKMPPDFQKVVLNLKKGQVSGVVESGSRYYLIKLTDQKEAASKSLKEATPSIEQKLKAAKIASIKKHYREEAGVKILDEGLKKESAPAVFPFPKRN